MKMTDTIDDSAWRWYLKRQNALKETYNEHKRRRVTLDKRVIIIKEIPEDR